MKLIINCLILVCLALSPIVTQAHTDHCAHHAIASDMGSHDCCDNAAMQDEHCSNADCDCDKGFIAILDEEVQLPNDFLNEPIETLALLINPPFQQSVIPPIV